MQNVRIALRTVNYGGRSEYCVNGGKEQKFKGSKVCSFPSSVIVFLDRFSSSTMSHEYNSDTVRPYVLFRQQKTKFLTTFRGEMIEMMGMRKTAKKGNFLACFLFFWRGGSVLALCWGSEWF